MIPKSGPLTAEELLGIWRTAVDRSYRDGLIEAGEGEGLEVHTQAHAILARASLAIDRTTQQMFIVPWSGQTNAPASGARKATVTLTFMRTKRLDQSLVIGRDVVFIEEQQTDWGENGPVVVLTGRRYVPTEDLVFHPGDAGPFDVIAEAELVGEGHNNPMPGTIITISQPGAVFENDHASVLVTAFAAPGAGLGSSARATTPNEPDTFVPEHVGQYVLFTDGANAGRQVRISRFKGPDLSVVPAVGSEAALDVHQSFEATTHAGTFMPGEVITFDAAAMGIVVGERVDGSRKRVTYLLTHAASASDPAVGQVVTGQSSGATATIALMLTSHRLIVEAPSAPGVGGASWRILDWIEDWGLTVTNAQAPSGGRHAWLDELGSERGIDRASGELDESYRARVAGVADVVAPNAIRRALNRALGVLPWCFREVGTAEFPGFFFDGDGTPPHVVAGGGVNDAFDTDVLVLTGTLTSGTFLQDERVVLEEMPGFLAKATGVFGRIDGGVTFIFVRKAGGLGTFAATTRVRGVSSGAIFTATAGSVPASVAQRRFRLLLDYAEFRGFFLVGVPPLSVGEFGFAFDVGVSNAFDAFPYNALFDGYPALSAGVYSRVFHAVDTIRAGGVGWGLYVERGSCP